MQEGLGLTRAVATGVVGRGASPGEVLSQVLPALFPPDGVARDSGGAEAEAPTVIVQGIQAPLSTPALWLCQQLASADTMLYVCVRPPLGDGEVGPQPA